MLNYLYIHYIYSKIYLMKYASFLILVLSTFISCNNSKNKTSENTQTQLNKTMEIKAQEGIITKQSSKDFKDTYKALFDVIDNNPNLKIIAELDHQKNAASVDLSLNPVKIIMFGNPNLGTPLMQSSLTTGLDLPQKIMVWQDDANKVNVSYNDPLYLQARHSISEDKNEILKKIAGALDKISNAAAGL